MSNSHLIEHELMLLCQSIVADGKVDLDEIKALKKWLQRHRESDLPSVKSLADLVDRITADRKVTSSEQQELLGTLNNLLSQQTSPVEVACGGCGQRYATHATSIAQDVVCPACSTVVVVPSVGEVAANVVKPAARPSDFGQIPMNAMLAEARGRLGTKAGTTLGLGYVGIAIGIAFLLMGVFFSVISGKLNLCVFVIGALALLLGVLCLKSYYTTLAPLLNAKPRKARTTIRKAYTEWTGIGETSSLVYYVEFADVGPLEVDFRVFNDLRNRQGQAVLLIYWDGIFGAAYPLASTGEQT